MTTPNPWIQNQPLNALTTLGVGGPASLYQTVHTLDELRSALTHCQQNEIPWMILGRGSNSLFDDQGFPGAVVHNKLSFMEDQGDGQFLVGAGYNFSLLGTQTARKGWGGLEFACGIPGSVGGAVFMNAGANGQETAEVLEEVWFLHPSGEIEKSLPTSFGYRSSPYQTLPGAIVAAIFRLHPSPSARQRQKEILAYRTQTQPYGEKSAGSFFRNPPNNHAGALIEQLGWKGKKIGGAQISPQHANFLINTGQATAQDILSLSQTIQKEIREQVGIYLEREVCYFPHDETFSR